MSSCQSCGMPMMKPDDHGGSKLDNNYCKYCTDDQGNLLPKDQVREKMVQFHMQNLGKTQSQAEADVGRHMALMPAWKTGVGGLGGTPGSQPVSPGGMGVSASQPDGGLKPAGGVPLPSSQPRPGGLSPVPKPSQPPVAKAPAFGSKPSQPPALAGMPPADKPPSLESMGGLGPKPSPSGPQSSERADGLGGLGMADEEEPDQPVGLGSAPAEPAEDESSGDSE